jgi:hypothetical protein
VQDDHLVPREKKKEEGPILGLERTPDERRRDSRCRDDVRVPLPFEPGWRVGRQRIWVVVSVQLHPSRCLSEQDPGFVVELQAVENSTPDQ